VLFRSVPQQLEVIAETPSGRKIPRPAKRHLLRIRCVSEPAGEVRIGASVDGGEQITANDEKGMAPFSAAFAIVLTDRPQTDVRFDDINADGGS